MEDPDKVGQYVFDNAAKALEAAEALGQKIELTGRDDWTARPA